MNAVSRYKKEFPKLTESTIRGWFVKHRSQLETPKLSLEHVTIGAKRGRPLLLSDDLDFKLRSFLTNLRGAGGTKKQTCFVWCSHGFHKKRSFKIWAIFGVLRYRWLGAILVYQVYQDRLHTQNSDHFPTPVITVVVLVYHKR